MSANGEAFYKEHHQQMIALTAEIIEQAEFLSYGINPIGMGYDSWELFIKESRSHIQEIEQRLATLKSLFDTCHSQ